ncbi:zinc-binding dehydrogenase [Breznakiella homolactica]|uniref:Zinc-binding dehydrogenase n=1 Tax=Breznakiella homolactica TaxID=2798577 RepID=A0A7T8B9L7_9SPIR|nr:zinc-binding alcohol dehydrogenase [Breznakiella homolactica]QQO08436.1 zinc-binding dehydrogenase [Breznakiella homolactica]
MSDKNRKVAAVCDDGSIRLVTEPVPEVTPGTVLVRVFASLVSPGTELGGWKNLLKKKESGSPPGTPRKFGYSNAGIVERTGAGVTKFKPGDRVACIGYGFALHTDFAVVPQNLCVPLPDNTSYEQGSYAMLLATAMQSLRRCEPEFGERAAVVGLGLVGQLTAQLHQLAGNAVIGWARHELQIEAAKKWGIDAVVNTKTADPVPETRRFTKDYGLDTVVLAFAGPAGDAWKQCCDCFKKTPDGHLMGKVVIVGGSGVELAWIPANIDIRIAARTGPGYHDDDWELGKDYPPVFMRWTTQTNLELCMDLLDSKKVNTEALTTHRIPLAGAEEGINRIIREPDRILGLVFTNEE